MNIYHGIFNFRLEDLESEEVKEFVKKQVELTEFVLKKCEMRERLHDKLIKSYDYPNFGAPFREADQYFYFHNSGLQLQKVMPELVTLSLTDENPIRTLEYYSKPSHEGYRNTIELPVGNNVDPNQYLKDFLKLVDTLDLDGENKERRRLHLFQFSFRDQASNWLERLPAGSITTWEDLTTRFLAQFFSPRRTVKFRNDILMFQQHHRESLSEAWTHFKDLLQKVPHPGIDLWLQV
ncbi:zinc finger, CCHC-type containing protein [Tanacetum coccineum]